MLDIDFSYDNTIYMKNSVDIEGSSSISFSFFSNSHHFFSHSSITLPD